MIHRIEIASRDPSFDARGHAMLREIQALGVYGVRGIAVQDVYLLSGDRLTDAVVSDVCAKLLVDPVLSELVGPGHESTLERSARTVEVFPRPGVTDTGAESLIRTARAIGIDAIDRAATGVRYMVDTDLTDASLAALCRALLANEVVQAFSIDAPLPTPFGEPLPAADPTQTVTIRGLSDTELDGVSTDRRLALDTIEMRAVQAHFAAVGREPTDLELEMLAQTWSEHCVHKTFKALIHHSEPGRTEVVDSMFDCYIKAATRAADSPWLKSVFVDNAGIVGFDEHFDLAFKVETHNHPSALEPFGGANTGVGGVIRDVIGVSAYPIATTDVLCFGPADTPLSAVPDGVLHPRRIRSGVVAGVEDYGNKMGIPTVNGAVLYDEGYTANPLVFCGCLGILPIDSHRTDPQPGDLIVVLGGRTGRDGLRGATFSSMEMGTETALIAGSSVQIGNPIAEKMTLEAVRIARDEGLYTAVTDCGAGGLSSAVGEMAHKLGAVVHLERAPLKYKGLAPWEVWLSEAQERMVLAVPEARCARLQAICDGLDVELTVLGTFSDDGQLQVMQGDERVGDLPMALLHDGIPRRELRSRWDPPPPEVTATPAIDALQVDLGAELCALLATPDIRSKEDIVRTYDHEVQGGTVVKPFCGPHTDGPTDGAVLVPLSRVEGRDDMSGPGVALAVGINPTYGKVDPYAMAWAAIDECFRNLVAVGADPDQVALLDNFCWGNPKLPDRLGGLVRCARGCYDAALAYHAPYISGKDSLNNEYSGGDGTKHAIPGTLLISGLGIVPDANKTATSDFAAAGDVVFVIGETNDELGGSAFWRRRGLLGADVPQPVKDPMLRLRAVHRAIVAGLARSVHDCSEGGLAVGVAEMCIGGRLGASIDLALCPKNGALSGVAAAFSETSGRFIIGVKPSDCAAFEALFAGIPAARVGHVTETATLRLCDGEGTCWERPLQELVSAFGPA